MHLFPKIFSHSSGRLKSRADTSSSRRPAKPKRLERSYAIRNINYEFSPSPEDSSHPRSSDFYAGKTSFRIDGTEGELEIICETFGFSGIDDFAISPEEYEAMKVSSSAPVACVQNFQKIGVDDVEFSDRSDGAEVKDAINRKMEVSDMYVGCSNNSSHVVIKKFEGIRDLGCIDRYRANVSGTGVTELSEGLENSMRINDAGFNDQVSGRSKIFRGNGIKGVQPTVLVPPPASIGFRTENDTFVSGFHSGFCLVEDKKGTTEKDMGIRVVMGEENCVLSGSCSFTSNDDDDSSSTVTEFMSSISSSERYRRVINDWQKGDLLGRGSFGSVYEGIADDGFFFAVKEVSLLDQRDEAKQCIIQLEQEIALLSQFEHENIVQYYGTKKDESHFYIFLELVTKGSLLSLYQKYELRGPIVAAYTRQILHGLKYLHDRNVIHRDIKCANILVHTNGLVKLADFGLAKAAKLNDVKSCKGTAYWMAPEVVRSRGYGLAADIWSLGCTVLEMLTRRFPYCDLEYMSALYKIGQGERPHIPDTLSRDARNFILQCRQVDPSLRPTAAQLLDHPFVKRSLLSSSITASPHSLTRQI